MFLSLQFYYDEDELQADTPIESLSLNLSTYKPLKSLSKLSQVFSPIFLSEKLISNLWLMPQNNPFYSYNEALAKKGKKDLSYPFSGEI